jgi:hypothetical protein
MRKKKYIISILKKKLIEYRFAKFPKKNMYKTFC